MALAVAPLAWVLRGKPQATAPTQGARAEKSMREAVRDAWADPSFVYLTAGFFVCGFHVAFIATHLPGVVAHCGLPPAVGAWSLSLIGLFNIAGSFAAGSAIGRSRMKSVLSLLYASRAVAVLAFLASPKSIEAELERIALDAHAANRRGAPLSDAVVDFANYPHLARVHAFVDDILTLNLPAEVVDWVESLLSMPEPPSWEGMRTALVSVAGDDRHPRLQALAQFALFEAVRLNLVVMTRWFPDETLFRRWPLTLAFARGVNGACDMERSPP